LKNDELATGRKTQNSMEIMHIQTNPSCTQKQIDQSLDSFRKKDADVKRTWNDREKLGRGRRHVYIKIVFRNSSVTSVATSKQSLSFFLLYMELCSINAAAFQSKNLRKRTVRK
jgi:hypothetical protein